MQIIPVIDLKDNQVVHAKHGLRAQYQPIKSSLSDSSNPSDIVSGLLKLYPFNTIYIADIDAIQGTGSHSRLIEQLCSQYPKITWWVDSGKSFSLRANNLLNIIGSESIAKADEFGQMRQKLNQSFILSLDYLDGKPLGLSQAHADCKLWPPQVICMTLNAVGSNQGPDLLRIQSLQRLSKQSAVYAAGGVRDLTDLKLLKAHRIAGVLIATALHSGKISAHEIAEICQ